MMKRKNMLQRLTAVLAVMLFMAAPAQAQPKAFVHNAVHDFGAVSHSDGPRKHYFWVVNTGDEPLVLQGYKTACGCTDVHFVPKPVAPGKATVVIITYHSPNQKAGHFSRSVTVSTNAPEGSITLTLEGEVLDD